MTPKQMIRREVLEKRANMSEQERKRGDILITERLLGHQWFYRAGKLLIFVSYGDEIDTTALIEEAIRMGKEVYVPKVEGENIRFYQILSLDQLEDGYKGIREPKGDEKMYEYDPEDCENTLLIMPGVAFDPMKHRIGYGKGFYDRFLQDKEALRIKSIAIGYACQLVECIEASEFDLNPYQVILV